jgi:hypothetical protein
MAPVVLHLYDLSQGMARTMSMAMIGKQLDGIWHSGIAVFGVEYFYGGGICAAPAGRAIPHLSYQEITLGATTKTQVELEGFLQTINHRFTQATYSLLRHNCNNFANEVALFLTGKGIPEHIIRLPQEFLSSPMGATLAPMIEMMEQRMRDELVGGGRGLNPFGHIQGRVPLFPPSPAVADNPQPILRVEDEKEPEPIWLEGDVGLIKIAVDGIPVTIMSPEIKARIAALDKTACHELIGIIKKELKNKPGILLSFATIIRFYWTVPEFRKVAESEAPDNVLNLLAMSIRSANNTHVFTAGLAATINISASMSDSMSESLSSLLSHEIIPLIVEQEPTCSASARKMVLTVIHNCLFAQKFTKEQHGISLNLLRTAIRLAICPRSGSHRSMHRSLLMVIDRACLKVINTGIDFDPVDIEIEQVVEVAERAESEMKLELPSLIRIFFD